MRRFDKKCWAILLYGFFFFQLQFPNGFMEICTFMRKLHPDLDRTTPEDRTLMTGVTSWRAQIAKFACLKVGRVHT